MFIMYFAALMRPRYPVDTNSVAMRLMILYLNLTCALEELYSAFCCGRAYLIAHIDFTSFPHNSQKTDAPNIERDEYSCKQSRSS